MKRFISSEGVLRLWHGSNQPVLKPDLSRCVRNGDFGKYTFYTGDREDLALERARLKSIDGCYGKPTVTQYTCNTAGLTILQFDKADIDWILAVVDGRTGISPPGADIVIGPIADGKDINRALMRFSFLRRMKESELNIFERGKYSSGYKELLHAELSDLLNEVSAIENTMQYAFCTPNAIERLIAFGYKEYDGKGQVVKTITCSEKSTEKVKPMKAKTFIMQKSKTKITIKPKGRGSRE